MIVGMGFAEPELSFQEADRRYAELKRQHEAGGVGDQEFNAQVKQLMVLDDQGRWWAKSGRTGEWHYLDGDAWVPSVPPGYPVKPNSLRKLSGVAAIGFVALVLVVAGGWLLYQSLRPQPLEVPSLLGLTQTEAQDRIDKDFAIQVAGKADSSKPEGLIVRQTPAGGKEALPGSTISVIVSTGREFVLLPDVTGQTREAAEANLASAGLEVSVEIQESSEESAGKVIQQSPSGGEAEKGSTVMITVGQAPEPAPGYDLAEDPTGSLTVEVPTHWTVLKGPESENPSGFQVRNWSKFLDEDITSSMIAAPDIGGYLTGGELGSGMYIVASRTLAQRYSEEEAIYNAVHNASDPPFPNLNDNCEAGTSEDLDRPHWSGKVQTWRDCRGLGITDFLVAATPEGGGCMVFIHFKMISEAAQETKEHMLNTFEVDCDDTARIGPENHKAIAEVARSDERISQG